MSFVPEGVDFISSAASSAAKQRGVIPTAKTRNTLDVANALKCMTVYQTLKENSELADLDEEKNAAPLIAAARILLSTAQYRSLQPEALASGEVDRLRLNAALAFAMYGNFPSASAALAEVSEVFRATSATIQMVAFVCDPRESLRVDEAKFEPQALGFLVLWKEALTADQLATRIKFGAAARECLIDTALRGSVEDAALAMSARMAARQAERLATANLYEAAPELPKWFVRRAIKSGLVTLLPPQRQLLVDKRIALHGRNTLLTLPTSTGKTFLAEACMVAGIKEEGSLCVYVAPYVAIGEQVKESLGAKLGNDVNLVSMFGGFKLDAVSVFDSSEAIVATPERFDAWLRAADGVDRLRTVVFDEIHIIESEGRGTRVEGIVGRLRLLQKKNPKLRIVGLSAVLKEPDGIRKWLDVADGDLHEISWRPTARRLAMCLSNGDLQWVHGNDSLNPEPGRPRLQLSEPTKLDLPRSIKPNKYAVAGAKDAAENVAAITADMLTRLGFPGLVVCPRRADTRILARQLSGDADDVGDEDIEAVAKRIEQEHSWLAPLVGCLRKGYAYHNASLPFDVRRDIERLTRARKLKVVCATTTLAEGADLPFRWTVVSHFLTGFGDTPTPMKAIAFRNIAGRCGRAGAFSEGDTVLFENLLGPPSTEKTKVDRSRLEGIMFSSEPLESTVGKHWADATDEVKKSVSAAFGSQLLASIGEHPNSDNIVDEMVNASYAAQCGAGEELRSILGASLQGILDATAAGGAFAVANSPVRLTELGIAASRSGFSPDSCRKMLQFLNAGNFAEAEALYANLLLEFSEISEQSSFVLRKVCGPAVHKFPLKAKDLITVLQELLVGNDLHEVFERLPARLKSKAKVDTVEGQFDQFVSLVDGVFGNFLPWLLRGLEGLKEFSSSESGRVREWALMATQIETGLAKRMNPDLVVEEAVEE